MFPIRRRKYFQCPVLCCLLWLAGGAPLPAANWPGFRGPAADGIAEKEKAPAHFGPSSNLLWKTEIPHGHSSPVIWNGQLFLTGEDGNKLGTLCLDGVSGGKLWEQITEVEKLEPVHQANSHATSTPATDGKRLFVYRISPPIGARSRWSRRGIPATCWRAMIWASRSSPPRPSATTPLLSGY